MHARGWQSGELKQLRNFSTVWQAADRVVMMMLEPDYFNACIDHRRCAAYVGPYRDRERIMAGFRPQWNRSLGIPHSFSHADSPLGNPFSGTDRRPGFLDWPVCQEGHHIVHVSSSTYRHVKA